MNDIESICKGLSDYECRQIRNICELAYAGDKQARSALSIMFGEIKTLGDIYNIDAVAFARMSDRNKDAEYAETTRRLSISPLVPLKTKDVLNKLVLLRTEAKLTQQSLANASGVNIRQIQRYESGTSGLKNITLANAVALAQVLGVTAEDLLGGE